jgi:hypothetical protein
MTPEDRLIQRFISVYGEPKTPNPEMFLNEFAEAISGWNIQILDKVGSDIIRSSQFWPKPAEIIERAKLLAAERSKNGQDVRYRFKSKMGPYDPATVEQWKRAAEWRASLPDDHPLVRQAAPLNRVLMDVSRPAFEKMMRESPNQGLYRIRGGKLTEASRKMAGERDE